MAWLPQEDFIAGKSEELILRYNPSWTGGGETRKPILVPDVYQRYFDAERAEIFDLSVPFTAESWHGRIKTCRAIEASMSAAEVESFDAEHKRMLDEIAPASFSVLHYAALAVLKKKG